MKKRKRKEPGPLALDPLKIELPAFEIPPLEPLALDKIPELPKINLELPKLDIEPLDLKLGPLPEIDLDKLPDPLADGPRKARKRGKRHRRAP
jgi:hypothetical protein